MTKLVYYYPFEVVKDASGGAFLKAAIDRQSGPYWCCGCGKVWPCECPETEEEQIERTKAFIANHEASVEYWRKWWLENPSARTWRTSEETRPGT